MSLANPRFFGAGYEKQRDHERLTKSLRAVYDAMKDEQWHTLEDIAEMTDKPEASISAHIRSLRRPENGGYYIERRHVGSGLHKYRLDHNMPSNWKPKLTATEKRVQQAMTETELALNMSPHSMVEFGTVYRSMRRLEICNETLAKILLRLLDDVQR